MMQRRFVHRAICRRASLRPRRQFSIASKEKTTATCNPSLSLSGKADWRSHARETLRILPLLLATVGGSALILLSPSSSSESTICDAPEHENYNNSNPLWPSGVSTDMVNHIVDDIILADPTINMKLIPDSMERVIYVSTVRLTLNTIYEALSSLHGIEVLSHRIVLEREKDITGNINNNSTLILLSRDSSKIDITVLEALADELLKSKAINQRWLPDILERQIYTNCLFVVFTILDKVAETISIRMCGHELSLRFEPVSNEKARELAMRHGSDRLKNIDEAALDALVAETVAESLKAESSVGAVASYLPLYRPFLRALHKTLYSLILGLLDDLLQETEITVLDERIQIKLVPNNEAKKGVGVSESK